LYPDKGFLATGGRLLGQEQDPLDDHPQEDDFWAKSKTPGTGTLRRRASLGRARKMFTFLLLISLATWPGRVRSLKAFDCSGDETTFRSLNLLKAESCPDPEEDFESPIKVSVQVVQLADELDVTVNRCQFKVDKEVTQCGFDSLRYHAEVALKNEPIDITPSECRRAIEERKFHYQGQEISIQKLGTPVTKSFITKGAVNKKTGRCTQTETFYVNNVERSGYYETTIVHGTTQRLKGRRLATGDAMTVDGIATRYSLGGVYDSGKGNLIWNVRDEPKCNETLSEVLYTPNAVLHRRKGRGGDNYRGSIMMLHNQPDLQNRAAALILGERIRLCNERVCTKTQVPNLVACMYKAHETKANLAFKSDFDQREISFRVQMSYSHITTHKEFIARLREVSEKICGLKETFNDALLNDVSGNGNKHALVATFGEGHRITVAGAVAYVAQCPERAVQRVESENCTSEVPVSYLKDNKTVQAFMDPITRVLTPVATPVPCDRVMPVKWYLDGRWYCATPHAVPCSPPDELPIEYEAFRPGDYTHLVGADIYSPTQREQHLAAELIRHSVEAYVAEASSNAVKDGEMQDGGGFVMGSGLGSKAKDALVASVVGNFIFIPALAGLWKWLVGTGLVISLAYTIVAALMRMYWVWRREGFSLWVLGAAFGIIFQIAYLPVRVAAASFGAMTQGMNRSAADAAAHEMRGPDINLGIINNRRRKNDGRGPPPAGGGGATTTTDVLIDVDSAEVQQAAPYRGAQAQLITMGHYLGQRLGGSRAAGV
jgi:hypothetical protein